MGSRCARGRGSQVMNGEKTVVTTGQLGVAGSHRLVTEAKGRHGVNKLDTYIVCSIYPGMNLSDNNNYTALQVSQYRALPTNQKQAFIMASLKPIFNNVLCCLDQSVYWS